MLTDTHCHLNLPEFEHDLDQVIQSARETGLKKILVPGIDLSSSIKAVELAEKYPGLIYAGVGIHPNYASDQDDRVQKSLRSLLSSELVVAVGEIGLDYYRDFTQKEVQKKTFRLMLDLAAEYMKPVCIHQRSSNEDLIGELNRWQKELASEHSMLLQNPGVFHSFGGEWGVLEFANNHNYFFGISGFITYKKAVSLREMLGQITNKRILLETDSPYITPEPHRGKRNEPSNVYLTAKMIANTLEIDINEVENLTTANAAVLFNW